MKRVAMALLMMTALALPSQQPAAKKPAAAKKSAAAKDLGERAFLANCSRCHSAPEQIRRSIAGTVLKHMRVRASLSEADEKAILQYLAP